MLKDRVEGSQTGPKCKATHSSSLPNLSSNNVSSAAGSNHLGLGPAGVTSPRSIDIAQVARRRLLVAGMAGFKATLNPVKRRKFEMQRRQREAEMEGAFLDAVRAPAWSVGWVRGDRRLLQLSCIGAYKQNMSIVVNQNFSWRVRWASGVVTNKSKTHQPAHPPSSMAVR